MKKLVAVCLGVILSSVSLGAAHRSSLESFSLADRVGDPNARAFFLFSTAAGKYIVRQDGMGEVSANSRRRVFYLRVAGKGRISSVYFLEHEGDLLLLYEVSNQGSYLVRLEQTKRKPRWSTLLETSNVEAPVIEGDLVIVKEGERSIKISKADGRVVKEG